MGEWRNKVELSHDCSVPNILVRVTKLLQCTIYMFLIERGRRVIVGGLVSDVIVEGLVTS